MKTLMDAVIDSLKVDERLIIDGKLAKNKIVESALNLDPALLKLLLNNEQLKNHFFTEVEGMLIFDKVAFQRFVNNKSFLPDSFTQFKNKIGLTVDTHYLSESNDVVLSWPYKDCVLEGGQTKDEQKRDEIFWNETLAPEQVDTLLKPKVLTNFVKYEQGKVRHEFDISTNDNLIIRGNNLLALESLKKTYAKQIKLIYIDPPYYFHSKKSEDTFQYNSNFKLSTWLTFMKNRLEAARELLSDDGAIFVQISDDGVAELHLLMKEIFNKNQNNFINKITLRTKSPSGFASVNAGVFETAEYILCYAKDKTRWTYNEQYVPCDYDANYNKVITNYEDHYENWMSEDIGEYVAKLNGFDSKKAAQEQIGKAALFNMVSDFAISNGHRVYQSTAIGNKAGKATVEARDKSKDNRDKIFKVEREEHYDVYVHNGREMAFYLKKIREIDGKVTAAMQLTNIWSDISYEGIASEGSVSLKGGKKPEKLIRRIIEMASNEGDIVLDYHLGSGTTVAAAHKLNRRYIGIEQLNYGENDCVSRLKNVIASDKSGISKQVHWEGGGSFVYCELASLAAKYLEQIEDAKNYEQLISIWNQLRLSSNLSYKVNPKNFDKNVSLFEQLSLEDQKAFLIEVLDKNQLYVNYSDIDDETNKVSDLDNKYNKAFYGA